MFDKLPDVDVILVAIIDGDIFVLSFGFGLSTLTRETEPSGLEWFVLEDCKLPVAIISLFLVINETPCSLVTNAVNCSSSSRLPSYSRISSVT